MRRIVAAGLMAALILSACAADDPSITAEPGTTVASPAAGSPSMTAEASIPEPASSATAGGATSDGPSDGPAAAPTSEAPPPANAGALDFTARRVGGGTVDGPYYAGGPVVLWMWAPWCPQCNREAPHVAEVLANHGGDVTFIGIAGHDDDAAHEAFVDEHGLGSIAHAIDEDGSLWAQYGVSYQPAWVFIAEDGTTTLHAGPLYGDLEDELLAFLAA